MTRAIIVDDEAVVRTHLRQQIERWWPELEVAAEANNGFQALEKIQQYQPDILFLDIQMPGMSGLEVAQQMDDVIHLVFVTAFDQYAVDAFEAAAVDYLLKPVAGERLTETIQRLKERVRTPAPDLSELLTALSEQPRQGGYLQWIKASKGESVQMIAVDEVDYFQAADKYTLLFSHNKEWVIRTPIKTLEDQLDPELFWRIHRGTIVRTGVIREVRRQFNGQMVAVLYGYEQPLAVSRSYSHRFRAD